MSRDLLDPILNHLRGEPSRTWSIIITVYGDAIVPRGGEVWLGTLLAFFKALGVSDGVVRTAMSRLASDGWLTRSKVGRNSFYRLADKGAETFRAAAEHIYNQRPPPWRGQFQMVLIDSGPDRETVRAAMEEAGWGPLAPGIWIAPSQVGVPDVAKSALRLNAGGDVGNIRELAARSWPLAAIADAYRRFLAAFEPLRLALAGAARLNDLDCLVARALLVHEYRRVVLRDPILPQEVLPEDWPGGAARALCAGIYEAVLEGSERWLDANAVDESGNPLPSARGITRRFK